MNSYSIISLLLQNGHLLFPALADYFQRQFLQQMFLTFLYIIPSASAFSNTSISPAAATMHFPGPVT